MGMTGIEILSVGMMALVSSKLIVGGYNDAKEAISKCSKSTSSTSSGSGGTVDISGVVGKTLSSICGFAGGTGLGCFTINEFVQNDNITQFGLAMRGKLKHKVENKKESSVKVEEVPIENTDNKLNNKKLEENIVAVIDTNSDLQDGI
ncbi:MAG: hypothetical protein RsTaC01_0489 [Candidatus Paraimprobicoccus trichonymphae]|uniref:Uncharacterized protein n=1 Tax=Candidatus Paraimprobicoccus trichonymphae TaxID=3033793 RepID=A0AA48L1E6_9FIRM|nr:MAG: hypothetical protein RsTaC01_0489 [Candidatus Paraimprobicoccus trichonymphae]